MNLKGILPFMVLSTAHILSLIFDQLETIAISKVLLMPALVYYAWSVYSRRDQGFSGILFLWLIGAIFFAAIGDTMLLVFDLCVPEKGIFFVLGLGAFLLTHLIYIKILRQEGSIGFTLGGYFFLMVLFLYTFLMLYWWLPNIGSDLKLPVIVYAMTIAVLAFLSIQNYLNFFSKRNRILLFGVLFFVVSDSFIGINKFGVPLSNAALIIMPSYLLGQYLIVKAMVNDF